MSKVGWQGLLLCVCAAISSPCADEGATPLRPAFESAVGIVASPSAGQPRIGLCASFGMVLDVHHITLMGDIAFPLSIEDSRLALDRVVPGNMYGGGLRYSHDFTGMVKSGMFCPAVGLGWYRTHAASDSVAYDAIYPLSLSPQVAVSARRVSILLDPAIHMGYKYRDILKPSGQRERISDGLGVLFAPRCMFSFVF